jgi:phosphatidylinositol dimannoside acyltransferase
MSVRDEGAVTHIRRRATLATYRLALALAGVVPPGIAYPALDRAADLVRLAAGDARHSVEENLAQVLGGRGPRHTGAVRGVFRHVLRNYYDTFRLPAISDAEIREQVVITGREHLRVALEAGRGAILVTPHVSSVAFAAQALALVERGGTVVVEPVEPPELLNVMLKARASHGLIYRTLGPRLFGELTETLRRNELVFLVVDRDPGGNGMSVPFFGRETRLPTGPALLSLRTGAPILPTFVSRRGDGRLDGEIGPPLPNENSGRRSDDVARITRLVSAQLEYHIGRYPEQWTVLQRVWGESRDLR